MLCCMAYGRFATLENHNVMEGGTEHDTEHAHKRKRHESVGQSVPDGVLPWRDK